METRTISGSRGKSLLLCLLSLGFALLALQEVVTTASPDWRAWLGLALFGPGTPIFAWLIIRPQRLILEPAGFTVAGGLVWLPKRISWEEVDGFFVYRLPRGGKMIGYNHISPRTALLAKLNRHLGAECALPKNFPGSPERLVDELNSYRARALARAHPGPVVRGRSSLTASRITRPG